MFRSWQLTSYLSGGLGGFRNHFAFGFPKGALGFVESSAQLASCAVVRFGGIIVLLAAAQRVELIDYALSFCSGVRNYTLRFGVRALLCAIFFLFGVGMIFPRFARGFLGIADFFRLRCARFKGFCAPVERERYPRISGSRSVDRVHCRKFLGSRAAGNWQSV